MSTNSIEKALWKALSEPREMDRLRADAPGYLSEFNISEEERELILNWDVAEIVRRDVSPLLLLSVFSGVNGARRMPEYLEKINQDYRAPA
ncbi:hypothetical protein [Novosphingobium pentaromativorans]|uniref:Extradiol ring-cleavage dioxygenase LigAB LigA subunit domain-containing protein n=1 Tax=Novosphingobium pentaromativorans US6-1 TaxID=1088721 RepID=G6EKS1_9SPHN|nr:hypothetical protein [Novosphingobium pentaromativorans]AIT80491.1 hypothetical protein JI59_12235 [Novosphingobium pentaromativorans US6-1]EHJ58100.1 hypothetical protein NSU_4942 [Novosphingobium pentaromativorans US6-1]